HSHARRGAVALGDEQPSCGDESKRGKTRGFKFITGLNDSGESFLVIQVEEFAFVASVNSGHEFFRDPFVGAPWPLVKVTVNHNLVTARFKIAQPGDKSWVPCGASLAVIIGHHQK